MRNSFMVDNSSRVIVSRSCSKPILTVGSRANNMIARLIGMAKKDMKCMIDIQLPIPEEQSARPRFSYFVIIRSLIKTSSILVRKEKSGASGNETAKKAMKPS